MKFLKITTSLWSLFFVFFLIIFNFLIFLIEEKVFEKGLGYGGPVNFLNSSFENFGSIQGGVIFPVFSENFFFPQKFQFLSEEGLIFDSGSPMSNLYFSSDGFIKYKVLKGDNFLKIASKFNLSLEDLKSANPGFKTLKPGQEIILPLFQKPFKTSFYSISFINSIQNLPDLKSYFSLPARGWNRGELHSFNAVDIVDVCGSPIYAAAEGIVLESFNDNRWNNGYGNYLILQHPNGTKTLYAHNLKNLVKVGDYVRQGEVIALMGKTGNTHGLTGCHLHFEVYGAKNPFTIK